MEFTVLKVLLCALLIARVMNARPAEIKPMACDMVHLPNLDFSQGGKSWTLYGSTQLDDVYQVGKADDGKPTLSMNVDDNSPKGAKLITFIGRNDFPAQAGYYRLQFQMRTDLHQGSAQLQIWLQENHRDYRQLENLGQSAPNNVMGQTPWTNYSAIYKVPAHTTATMVQFEADNACGSVSVAGVSLEKLSGKAGELLMQQLNLAAPDAPEFGAKMVATPCRVVNTVGHKLIYQPPGLDHPVLVLNSSTSGGVASAVFVDYIKGTSTVVPFPSGCGGWDIIETTPGKLLFESLSPLSLVTIDTTGGHYKIVSDVPVTKATGNIYAWSFAKGNDGTIYFGSYPTCHAYSYDPRTEKVKDLGYIGPKGNLYVRNIAVDDRGYLLCTVHYGAIGEVAYNLKTGAQTLVVQGDSGDLVQMGGRVYLSLDGKLQIFDPAVMKFTPVTSPAPPQGLHWKSLSHSSTPARIVLRASDNNYYLCEPEKPPRMIWNLDLNGAGIIGIDANDNILGQRGQSYFVAKPLAKIVQFKMITDKPIPVAMHFIEADPAGGVTGGPMFGQTLFRYDGARHLEQNTDQVSNSAGEVYDGKWIDGKFYFVSYSGGELGVWDPAQPWDQIHNANPKILQDYSSEKFGFQMRPIGGMAVGPGGKLYAGWSAKKGKDTGALTEYDPATGKARAWSSDLFAATMSIGKIAADAKYVYGVTSNEHSGISIPLQPIDFWMFDPNTQKIVFQQKLPVTRGLVFVTPKIGHVWLADEKGAHLFDVKQMKFTQTLAWPKSAGAPRAADKVDERGNHAWIFAGNRIARLDDNAHPTLKVLFQTEKSGELAAGYDGKLYFTQGIELWAAPLEK
jgi:hypothetical protein